MNHIFHLSLNPIPPKWMLILHPFKQNKILRRWRPSLGPTDFDFFIVLGNFLNMCDSDYKHIHHTYSFYRVSQNMSVSNKGAYLTNGHFLTHPVFFPSYDIGLSFSLCMCWPLIFAFILIVTDST